MTQAPGILFEDYLERLERTATAAESWAETEAFFRDLGFELAMYVAVAQAPEPAVTVLNNFPAWFNERYIEQDYVRDDPAAAVCARQLAPQIVGSEARPHWDVSGFSERAWQISFEVGEFGYRSGILFPIRSGGRALFGGVAFATGMHLPEFERFLPEVKPFLNLAAWYLHARLQIQFAQEATEAAHLTPRERECLLWAAQGLSSKETARKLCVSPQAIDFHVLNASKKLGAANRVHAVARALALGTLAL